MLNNRISGQFSDSVIAESTGAPFQLIVFVHPEQQSAKPTISHLHQQSAFRKTEEELKGERRALLFLGAD